ncbi:MAG: type III secretion system chaperone [Yersinia sp. (in: enterobacteria)]
MKEKTRQLLDDLLDTLGMGEVTSTEERHCTLLFDEKLVVNLEVREEESRLFLSVLIGSLPMPFSAELMKQLLVLNLDLARYNRMSLGLERHSGQLLLCHDVNTWHASLSNVEEALAQLLNQAEQCQNLLH